MKINIEKTIEESLNQIDYYTKIITIPHRKNFIKKFFLLK